MITESTYNSQTFTPEDIKKRIRYRFFEKSIRL